MKVFITYCVLFITIYNGFSQSKETGLCVQIINHTNEKLYVYKCYTDTLMLIDSVITDDKGNFSFSLKTNKKSQNFNTSTPNPSAEIGLYRFNLSFNQWFYALLSPFKEAEGCEVKMKIILKPDIFITWSHENFQVLKSADNKLFYRFQELQAQHVVADKVLKAMLRYFPYYDFYRKEMEKEYLERYQRMDELLQEAIKEAPQSAATKIIKAYYSPNPAWDQPDTWRDSIIAAHYFDYFNPADSFYLHTNILTEKIDNYFDLFSFKMRVNRETYSDYEKHIMKSADDFLKHTVPNSSVHDFCLQYILKKLDKEKMYDALFSVYDKWVYHGNSGDCEQTNSSYNKWREKVSVLRNVQLGNSAPDFVIFPGKLNMSQLQAENTLIIFWASWCSHCTQIMPQIKKIIEEYQKEHKGKKMMVVFVSLDNEEKQWRDFIEKSALNEFIHVCEFKGWNGTIGKNYNVYATPTMFLLDKDKKIISKPESIEQLINNMAALSNQ